MFLFLYYRAILFLNQQLIQFYLIVAYSFKNLETFSVWLLNISLVYLINQSKFVCDDLRSVFSYQSLERWVELRDCFKRVLIEDSRVVVKMKWNSP